MNISPAEIKKILHSAEKHGMPGLKAQKKMAPLNRMDKSYRAEPSDAQKSSVLILLYQDESEIVIPFIERADEGKHAGQIALPGGKKEHFDTDNIVTAFREAEEEIGINRNKLEYLGTLSPLYIPVSNYIVYPIVAYTETIPTFKISKNEVKRLHIIPFKALMEIKPITKNLVFNKSTYAVPFYSYNSTDIWGATAMIISEFRDIFLSRPL
ncbi:MAG: CoA pyrophosphatase [Bacteroidota bacterium]|nr:CoA pyrophosphatase [Bacteroidota bacterium]